MLKEITLNIHQKEYFEADAPIFWPPDVKSQLIGKEPDVGGEGADRGQDGWVASPTQCT